MRRADLGGVCGFSPRTSGRSRSERGAVTAETMVVLPLLVAVATGLVWLLALAGTQARLVDAARETARSAARHDPPARSLALGRRVAPDGCRLRLDGGPDVVVATVECAVDGPGGLFGFLPAVRLDAEAVAAREPR